MRRKFPSAAANAIPSTTECEVIKLDAIRNSWDWKKIRDDALTYKTIAYPNTADFDKLIGVKSVLQTDAPSSDYHNDESHQIEFAQKCNALQESLQEQINGFCDALKQQDKQGKRQYNRKPTPANVTPPGPLCGACGKRGHTTSQCTSPNKYIKDTRSWIANAKCKACQGIGHVWKNCVDRFAQRNLMQSNGWKTQDLERR